MKTINPQQTTDDEPKNIKGFKTAKDLLGPIDLFSGAKYVTKEFQDFGYRLAMNLNDLQHKSLYIKLAKQEKRSLIEKALRFTADYPNAKSKGKIFMWKLKELKADTLKGTSEKAAKPIETQQPLL